MADVNTGLNLTKTSPLYAKVALPVPLQKTFEYIVPVELRAHIQVGMRVQVPFGNKRVIGVVCGIAEHADFDPKKLKEITKQIDHKAIFDSQYMSFINWLSEFYLHPIGDVFQTAMPRLLRQGHSVELEPIAYLSINEDVCNASDIDEHVKGLKKSKRQLSLFELLVQQDLEYASVRQEYSSVVIKALIDKKLIKITSQNAPTHDWHQRLELQEKLRANPEQAIAIATINNTSNFSSILIEGVTGSGKTEVYLQVIEEVLKKGRQVLILVPEIGLTPQTYQRFERRFGAIVAAVNSSVNDTERLAVFKQVQNENVGIVIGTRSSIFLPFSNLGLIIVDEEHDESFKQQDGLRYHARDLAVYRAKQFNIPLLLGSATPSLESLYNAVSGKYQHLQLLKRAGNASSPTQHLLDITGLPLKAGIAPAMILRMRQHLQKGNQVIVYVGRRGYAPALICQKCGHVEHCSDCDVPFTVHQQYNYLQCHRCGKQQALVYRCRQCGASDVITQGVGTEQVESFLSQDFSEYSCTRIDSDSMRGKNAYAKRLAEISQNKHQILVGTQILAKGHHFPNVTLTLILNVDSYLFSSDFRASEKLAQLVTQIGGRAGRAGQNGEMWLQTYQVGHPLLQDLVHNGYQHFARSLLQERRGSALPPSTYQICLRAEHSESKMAFDFLRFARQLLEQFKQLDCLGPFPAQIEKKQNRYRFILLIQSKSIGYLNETMKRALSELDNHPSSHKIRWHIDVMPVDIA